MAILVGSGLISLLGLVGIIALFVAVLIPAFEFGGREQIPSDLPVYPGAKLELAYANGFQGCTDVSADWSTADPSAEVVDFYRTQLNTGPWALTGVSTTNGAQGLSFTSSSGPHREGVITVTSTAGGGSDISLELAKSSSSRSAVSSCHILVGQTG